MHKFSSLVEAYGHFGPGSVHDRSYWDRLGRHQKRDFLVWLVNHDGDTYPEEIVDKIVDVFENPGRVSQAYEEFVGGQSGQESDGSAL